jgi:succinate dehydrogenase (ubiquinone) iron-sulfur subunit
MLTLLCNSVRRGSLQQLSCLTVASAKVTTSAQPNEPQAAASVATGAKPSLYKDFQVYRWTPDSTDKPSYATYKVDINRYSCRCVHARVGRGVTRGAAAAVAL